MRLPPRLVAAAALAVCAWHAPAANAQTCDTCGPRQANSYVDTSPGCGHFGLKIYPKFESRYIAQFCGPHICPSSCFGFFKPQFTRWGDACPHYGDPNAGTTPARTPAAPAVIPPADPDPKPATPPSTPANPTTGPKSTPLPKPTPQPFVVPPPNAPTVPSVEVPQVEVMPSTLPVSAPARR